MAERRMFHTAVVESDAFLDLPVGAQALYFHIGMHADDDGFVNGPKQITRTIGAAESDLQALVNSGFLFNFDGIMVVKHWRMANSLKNDRLRLPRYPEIAKKIYLQPTKSYTLTKMPGLQNLLANKKKLIKEYGIRTDSQKRGEEKKREEKKREEMRIEEERVEGGFPAEAGPTLTQDTELLKMNGILGKGVVLLSNQEQEALLDKLGLDGFDYYVEKLAKFILANNANIRNHYATILKWWQEDRGVVNEKN